MRYCHHPIMGATWYTGVWWGFPVQWCGMEAAHNIFPLSYYDSTYPWRKIVEGVAIAGMQLQKTVNIPGDSVYGCYPDGWDLLKNRQRYFWDLGPDLQIEKAWLPPEEIGRWWELFRALPWTQRTIRISGRLIQVPRKEVVLADEGVSYGYSGQRLESIPWGEFVELRDRVSAAVGHRFNLCLLNLYMDKNGSVDWHSDDERELGPDPVVASLSFGERRLFEVKAAEGPAQVYRFSLGSGDLTVMPAGFQRRWMHRVPKTKLASRPRVSMTFRNIVR